MCHWPEIKIHKYVTDHRPKNFIQIGVTGLTFSSKNVSLAEDSGPVNLDEILRSVKHLWILILGQ